MTFSPPPDDSTEQSENTDNQGEENEGDEDEGDENQGDENQGDENQGDDNDGDGDDNDGDGDDNDGDGNDGDGNDGDGDGDGDGNDDNDGDGNDGGDGDDNDDTTGGVVPSDEVTEWSASVWEELSNTYGNDAVVQDFMYDDGLLYFCNGTSTSGFKFTSERVQVAGTGNATTCCLQFKVNTNGTLYVDALSSSSSQERTLNVYAGETLVGNGLGVAVDKSEHTTQSVAITVTAETTIAVASSKSGINIFSLKWVPTGVTE